jgi:choline dehydrogenase
MPLRRVLLDEQKRAFAVEFLDHSHLYRADPAAPLTGGIAEPRRTVRAKYEVILAGGTFNTPQLLMLSGIGPPEELERHGIRPEMPLPGVGRNLQDRYEVGICYRMKRDLSLLEHVTLTTNDTEYAEFRHGYGLYATNGARISIIKRSSHAQPDPDLCLFAIPGHFSGYRPGYSECGRDKDCFTWAILKAHTNNTAGRVRLNSIDPRDPPDINFHYFDEGTDVRGDDLDGVVSAIGFVRKITARTASLFDEEIPGETAKTRSELAQFVRGSAWGHHACGTCKIGADGDSFAVLDGRFQVRGTQGLRVVDASVIPKIPGLFYLECDLHDCREGQRRHPRRRTAARLGAS